MQFHRDTGPEANIIKAFGGSSILIGEITLTRSCIVTGDQLIDHWPVDSIDALTVDHLRVAAELEPELILLGAGPALRFPEPAIMASVTDAGVGFEVMDTAAACRTYNVLVHEGRHVAAALIIPPLP